MLAPPLAIQGRPQDLQCGTGKLWQRAVARSAMAMARAMVISGTEHLAVMVDMDGEGEVEFDDVTVPDVVTETIAGDAVGVQEHARVDVEPQNEREAESGLIESRSISLSACLRWCGAGLAYLAATDDDGITRGEVAGRGTVELARGALGCGSAPPIRPLVGGIMTRHQRSPSRV
ncbi:hypothetical protein [Rhodanobacter lindaniclasticus]